MGYTLLLTSAGLKKTFASEFLASLPKKPRKVGFIPTAADPEEDKWFVGAAKDEIGALGMTLEEIDLKDCHLEELFGRLSFCDIIFVNGGNTFYLLDWVRKSGFDRVIEPLLKTGKIYVGVSAGSILAGPDIEVAELKGFDTNDVGLTDLTSLNLTPLVPFVHYEEKWRSLIEEFARKSAKPVIALTDEQAVLVRDGKHSFLGPGEPLFFNGAETFFNRG